MTPAETATTLRQLMDWRHDKSNWPPSPMQIEKAIAAAIEMIERLESAEKERDNANAAAVGIALQAEGLRCENDALRAKVAEMEKQEPLITVLREPDYWSGGHFHKGTRPYISLRQMSKLKIGQKLYALPCTKGE